MLCYIVFLYPLYYVGTHTHVLQLYVLMLIHCVFCYLSRVLNVLRHWVDQHWYDFEMDKDLQTKFVSFLDSVKGKAMKKGADTIHKIISRKVCTNFVVHCPFFLLLYK